MIFNSKIAIIIYVILLIPTLRALIGGAPWVPTPRKGIERMLKAANIKKNEKVYDLGCGDGRLVELAVKKYQADGYGIELSPIIYFMAKIRKILTQSKVKIIFANFMNQNYKNADVVLLYLMPETNQKVAKKLQSELKKGSRVVTYAFQIKAWKPHKIIPRNKKLRLAPIFVYKM
ncbi:MAG: hypothetical protein UR27_C0003G0068 [Candidatus Peregrinibacteria bacterium GW2011_GWA2_33_10]|nr:MAG: hypothetical protein UR27_C0003G0068 [Candidatus Peregrinibacteria bacterium GW2011_GWA2_33_10]KKP40794.1 MAG: hypothetical protein UR30_C0004G0052 [Candidatus Peregrinibacteria bacterium GW2011_GWC2_33_13]OGJ48045.1 MAG: hypothetical protein A2229_03365 [Candidatus Peregrinibacteria bacterium RIFOXYA2_FULL_33_7]